MNDYSKRTNKGKIGWIAFVNFIRRHLRVLLSAGLAVLFLFLAIRDINWQEVAQTLLQVQIIYLLWGFCIFSLSLSLRSLRWRNLLSADKLIPPAVIFWATAVGYLGNTFLPARAGEVIRSVALGNKARLSKSFVFATAVTERVLDACLLVVTGLFLLPTLKQLPEQLNSFLWIIGPLSLLAFLTIAFSPVMLKPFIKILTRIHLPKTWKEKVSAFGEDFSLGAATFIHPQRALIFFLLSVAIWIIDGLGVVIMAAGMGLSIDLPQAILFLVALGLASALPSTPGYVGLYQITAVTILPSFGFTRSQALTYIFVLQFINVISVSVWGLLGLYRLGMKNLFGNSGQAE